jgi:four helix bundle protein
VAEATQASSRKDFVAKLSISQKEWAETGFWLRTLRNGKIITEEQFDSIYKDCEEIGKILSSIIKTAKTNAANSPLTIHNSQLKPNGVRF